MDAATVASKALSAISEVVQKELAVLVLVRDGPLSDTRLSDCCARLPLHFVREAAACVRLLHIDPKSPNRMPGGVDQEKSLQLTEIYR
jgi:hypothetical protein